MSTLPEDSNVVIPGPSDLSGNGPVIVTQITDPPLKGNLYILLQLLRHVTDTDLGRGVLGHLYKGFGIF